MHKGKNFSLLCAINFLMLSFLWVFPVFTDGLVGAQLKAGSNDLKIITEGVPKLWVVEKYQCRGGCDDTIKSILEKAKHTPQSFSDPTRRLQYDWLDCKGDMALWARTQALAEGLDWANGSRELKWRSGAESWGLKGSTATTGFVVCIAEDGQFEKLFTLIDYQGDRMIALVVGDFQVHYKAVDNLRMAKR